VLDRCLVGGGGGVGPPIMTPNTATGRQIVQTRDEVAILSEMNHDVRIVRLGARHQPLAVRPWMGDSIGHWEGETLVVETVGFHPEEGFRALFARRPIRTGLSILGIGLAVGSALALISLSRSIKDSTRAGLDEMGDDLVVMQKGASDIFGGFIPERTVERVAAIPGVARATGELFMFAPGAADRSLLTQGWSDTSYLWKKVPLREGRVPGPVRARRRGAGRFRRRLIGQEARRPDRDPRRAVPRHRHRQLHHHHQSRIDPASPARSAADQRPAGASHGDPRQHRARPGAGKPDLCQARD